MDIDDVISGRVFEGATFSNSWGSTLTVDGLECLKEKLLSAMGHVPPTPPVRPAMPSNQATLRNLAEARQAYEAAMKRAHASVAKPPPKPIPVVEPAKPRKYDL